MHTHVEQLKYEREREIDREREKKRTKRRAARIGAKVLEMRGSRYKQPA
jgi:hypothetical protein